MTPKERRLSLRLLSIALTVILVMGGVSVLPASAEVVGQPDAMTSPSQPASAEETPTVTKGEMAPAAPTSKTTAVFSTLLGSVGMAPVSAPLPGAFDISQPLGGGSINSGDTGLIVLIGDNYYQTFAWSPAGMTSALATLATQSAASPGDYVMYFGGTTGFTLAASDLSSGFNLPNVGTLVITGSTTDPNPTTPQPATAAPTTVGLLSAGGTVNFGCNVIMRNVRYNFAGIYMNGYDLTLGNQSWATGATTYSNGASSGTTTAQGADNTATMTVWSTGTGAAMFYGGMNSGTMNGNVAITINNTSGNAFSIYGAGYGTSSAPANLNGNATTTITGMTATATGSGLMCFTGGTYYGNVSGQITNTISGQGSLATLTRSNSTAWSTTQSEFVGGSYSGNIGTASTIAAPLTDMTHARADVATTNDYIIKSNVDTSAYIYGSMEYTGGNAYGGVIDGNVTSTVKTGTNGKGNISAFDGLGGYNTYSGGTGGTSSGMVAAFSFSSVDGSISGSAAAIVAAKAQLRFQVYGNVTNILRSGCFSNSDGYGYLKGTGVGGYIEGSAYTMVGTEGLVWKDNYDATTPYVGTAKDTVAGASGDMTYMYSNSPSAANNNNGQFTGFDLFGSGGSQADPSCQLVNGNTTLVECNVRARWTYGGDWCACQIGDSRAELWRGIVDTLEGAGYGANSNVWHVGSSSANVYGGQVDFFLSGNGWQDAHESGNASVNVYDNPRTRIPAPDVNGAIDWQKQGAYVTAANAGSAVMPGTSGSTIEPAVIINCSIAGTYGGGTPHTIGGDTNITVYGGDFSGTAGHGQPNGFCTSAANIGQVYGNGTMTMDFRANQYGFAIEKGDAASAGRPLNNTTPIIGTDGTQTLTLNILSSAASNANLNGLNLYGDAATNATNSKIGTIMMNINAPGAIVGNVYATNYSNVSGSTLLRNVTISLISASQIDGLSGGSITDNYTNAIASASAALNPAKAAVIHVGPQSTNPSSILGDWESDIGSDGYPTRINVTTNGIKNFTSMNVTKRLLMAAGSGSILNGGGATASATATTITTNHSGTYDQFGDVTINNQSGLGVTGSSRFIVGQLKVNGTGYVASTGLPAQIVVSGNNLSATDDTNNLIWLKYGTQAATTMSPATSYFGINTAWPILTFNSSTVNAGVSASQISPVNLTGVDPTTGQTFIGDNNAPVATTGTISYGNGVAIPGSVYRWTVNATPGTGKGAISYSVLGSPIIGTTLPVSGTLDIFGSSQPDTPSQSGSIAIPSSKGILPTFSFIPTTPSWGDGVTIQRSDHYMTTPAGANDHSIPAQTLAAYQNIPSATQTWMPTTDDTAYSFDINAQFSDTSEVTAKSVVLTQSQAQAIITQDGVAVATSAMGRPNFGLALSTPLSGILSQLALPLGSLSYRTIPVTWTAGDGATPAQSITVDIVVVPDGSTISTDGSAVLIANDATVSVSQAQMITDQPKLDAYTGAQVLALSVPTTTTPGTVTTSAALLTDSAAQIATISGVSGATGLLTVPLAYGYSYTDATGAVQDLARDVTLTIQGFGTLTISKTVTGRFGNRSKLFDFVVTLRDGAGVPLSGSFDYTGSVIAQDSQAQAPADGTLTLVDGSAPFMLSNDQAITIKGVPVDSYIQVVETTSTPDVYTTFFVDSDNPGVQVVGNNTTSMLMDGTTRTFDFTNAYTTEAASGLDLGIMWTALLPIILTLLFLGGALLIVKRNQKKGGQTA